MAHGRDCIAEVAAPPPPPQPREEILFYDQVSGPSLGGGCACQCAPTHPAQSPMMLCSQGMPDGRACLDCGALPGSCAALATCVLHTKVHVPVEGRMTCMRRCLRRRRSRCMAAAARGATPPTPRHSAASAPGARWCTLQCLHMHGPVVVRVFYACPLHGRRTGARRAACAAVRPQV